MRPDLSLLHSGLHPRQQLHQQPDTENDGNQYVGLVHVLNICVSILPMFWEWR